MLYIKTWIKNFNIYKEVVTPFLHFIITNLKGANTIDDATTSDDKSNEKYENYNVYDDLLPVDNNNKTQLSMDLKYMGLKDFLELFDKNKDKDKQSKD